MKKITGSLLAFFLIIQVLTVTAQQDQQSLQSYSKYDFVPGEKLEPIYLREVSFVKAPPPRHYS